MNGYGKRILVVNEDKKERQDMALVLEHAGFAVVQACDGQDALTEMRMRRFDGVVADYKFPHKAWFDFMTQSRVLRPETPVILVSSNRWDLSETSETAVERGAFAWIRKASDPCVLLSMLGATLEQDANQEPAHAATHVTV